MSTIRELCIACYHGRDQEVQTILSRGDLDINTKDGNGWTPLHYAMSYNHPSIVRMLLARPGLIPDWMLLTVMVILVFTTHVVITQQNVSLYMERTGDVLLSC